MNPSPTAADAAADATATFRRIARMCAIAVMAITVTSLVGWFLTNGTDADASRFLLKPAAATCLLLLAGSLVIRLRCEVPRHARVIATTATCCAGAASLAVLISQSLTQPGPWHFFAPIETITTARDDMSPEAAVVIAVLATAMILGQRRRIPVQTLGLVAFLTAYFMLVTRMFESPSLRLLTHSAVSLTPLTLLLMSLAVISSPGNRGLVVITGNTGADIYVRRLLPAAFILPLLLGWLRVIGQYWDLYDMEFGTALMVIGNALVMVAMIGWSSQTVRRLDARRAEAETELSRMTERLLLATRAASIGVWDYDPARNHLHWSDLMFQIYGVAPERFSATLDAWESTLHPDDHDREVRKVQAALLGENEFDSDFRVIWPDHSIHHIKANATVQRDDHGHAIHMIGTNWDITRQKRLEEQLARSNADLSQFAFAASHDLQEPLRAVAGCVAILARDHAAALDTPGRELLDHIEQGTRRMQALIRDLLEYSRIDASGRPPEPTRADEALNLALANLELAVCESQATITRDPLPTVIADPRQLARVFQNLISNSLKFRAAGRPPLIHVSARARNGEQVFAIEDNGIGIATADLTRIFEVFQRLHSRDEYPGTGIGLPLCKRILERHGGRIWAESRPGTGSTFFFSLPTAPDR